METLAQTVLQRRAFLRRGMGLGLLGLAALQGGGGLLGEAHASGRGALGKLDFVPRAKRVIFLYMSGGPSQLETFDHKPALRERDGQPMPASLTQGVPLAQLQPFAQLLCRPANFKFARHGQCGHEISSLLPHTAAHADDITIVRSMVTDAINHDPAHSLMNTGSVTPGRPSMGSWVYYGLGAETENLPGFVVLMSNGKYFPNQPISSRIWHSGFLPANAQGVHLSGVGETLPYLTRPAGTNQRQQGALISTVNELDALNPNVEAAALAARASQYEMAFRLQTSAPELMDFAKEPASVLKQYGLRGPDGSFAANCLLARRLAERGVRFIEVIHREWDHHANLDIGMKATCAEVDRGCGALLDDLKARGMLKDTLVVWGGEFGRTPMSQGTGRDHHMKAFAIWMAGGGIKPGVTYGRTDEFGYNVIENPMHVNDLHATMLHLLGIDHKRFTIRSQGRDMRLTDVGGKVVKDILA